MKKQKWQALLLAAAVAVSTVSAGTAAQSVQAAQDGGFGQDTFPSGRIGTVEAVDPWDGTADTGWYDSGRTEYDIMTAEQLAGLARLVNGGNTFEGKKIYLCNDIFLNDSSYQYEWAPIARGRKTTGTDTGTGAVFQGTFHGRNHVIYNIMTGYDNDGGLFGRIGEKGSVKCVDISQGILHSGGCIANVNEGVISFCDNHSSVGGLEQNTGGICNYNYNLVYGCRNLGEVWGEVTAGIVGSNCESQASVSQCGNLGTVAGCYEAAGIAVYNNGWVYNCYNRGVIADTFDKNGENAARCLCGIVYQNGQQCTVENCYSAGTFSYEERPWMGVCPISRGDTGVENSYGLAAENLSSGGAQILSRDDFLAPEMAGKLDRQTHSVFSVWMQDTGGLNDGFPITAADYSRSIGQCKIQPEAWILRGSKEYRVDLKDGRADFTFSCYYNDASPVVTIEDTTIAEITEQDGKRTLLLKKAGSTQIRVHFDETENNTAADTQITLTVTDSSGVGSGAGSGGNGAGNDEYDDEYEDDDTEDNESAGGSGDGNGGGTSTPGNGKIKVSRITIKAPTKQIAAGKKITLKATVSPKNAANTKVAWKSSNTKYATVNSKGVVTAKKAGAGKTVTITATAKDRGGAKASVRIKIMKHAVTGVKIKNAPKTLKAGKSVKLQAVVKTNGKNANKAVKWTSSNEKYATVDSKGKVKAKKAGKGKTVTIRVTSTDGTKKTASVKIRIK